MPPDECIPLSHMLEQFLLCHIIQTIFFSIFFLLLIVAAKLSFIINRESRIIFLRIVRISSLVAFPSKKAEYTFALQIISSILKSIKLSLKMVNLFQVLLAVCHKLIQQILYTQWNGFSPHFYRFIHTVSHKKCSKGSFGVSRTSIC